MNHTAMATSILALLLSVLPASAQLPDPHLPDAPDTTTTDTFALPAVVVTATRIPLAREALPTPVTVLTGTELRSRGVSTVAEALRSVPSATIARSGGSGAQTSLFLRGGENDYVKVLVDGVPVNDPGGAFDFAGLSMDHVERIEIVRGPVSVLYGSDAMAGVVQIFTRHGAGPPTVAAEVTAGSGQRAHGDERYGSYDAEASISGGTGSLSYLVGGGQQHSQGLYPLNNEHRSSTAQLRLDWTPLRGTELSLTSRWRDGRAHFPTDGAGNIVDENAYLDRRLWNTAIEGGVHLGDRVDARLQFALVTRDQTAVDERDGPADTTGTYAYTLGFDGTRRIADARVNARLLRSVLTAGVSWEGAEAETRYTSESAFGPYQTAADYDRSTTGYYVQLLSRPADPIHLTAGARVDDSETYGSFGTYRIGLALGLLDATRVRGAVGRGFREPTFAEAFGSGFGDIGNPALEPERSRSWEVGLEQELGPATLAATWFDQRFEDLIQFTFSPPAAGDPNYFNVGTARARGLELEGRAATGPWSVAASYTWLETEVLDPGLASDATFAEGQPLLRRPERSGTLTGMYAFGAGLVSLAVNGVGARDDVDFGAGFPAPRVSLPAYATLDLAGETELPVRASGGIRLLARIDNVLGVEYESAAGYPAGGRLIRLGLRMGAR